MSWKIKRRLREQLEREQGYFSFPTGTRRSFALVYPNSYFVGMSNLGLHIIYDLLNRRPDTACERFFLPSDEEQHEHERTGTPLLSLENQQPLHRFSLIGFAVSFEMDYFNLLRILQLGKVKLLAAERGEQDAIVLAGGPCATFNPEPLSLFVDAFVIGEGEVVMPSLMDAYDAAVRQDLSRAELLHALSKVEGVYVPSLYAHDYDESGRLCAIRPAAGAPSRVTRQWVRDLDEFPAHTVVVTDDTEFNLYLIETARGCGRHCRFCMAGYCFRQPRNRSLKVLEKEVQEAKKYEKRIGLMGAAISDYPEIDALCRDILAEDLGMSVASFRADSVTEELVASLSRSGLRTITLAPEAGSVRMRKIINKGIEEEHLRHTVDLALQAGIRQFRLYLMIGLPYEEEEDIKAIVDMTVHALSVAADGGREMGQGCDEDDSQGASVLQEHPHHRRIAQERLCAGRARARRPPRRSRPAPRLPRGRREIVQACAEGRGAFLCGLSAGAARRRCGIPVGCARHGISQAIPLPRAAESGGAAIYETLLFGMHTLRRL